MLRLLAASTSLIFCSTLSHSKKAPSPYVDLLPWGRSLIQICHGSNYFGAAMSRNNARPVLYPGRYNTDLISTKASALLREAMTHDDPWFLTVAPIAPHAVNEYYNTAETRWFGPPMSAPRHADLFKNYTIPQRASFNKPIAGAPSWVGRQRPLNATVLAYQEEFQRKRLRSLMAVDEMVRDLVAQLEEGDALNNTFIFYTTDNGYHISQHALGPGKSCGYGKLSCSLHQEDKRPLTWDGRWQTRTSTSHFTCEDQVLKLGVSSTP